MAFPQKFGKYTLLKRLATGGMAEIFLARQVGLDGFEKGVVLKRPLPSHQGDEDLATMFLDEARIAANLIHPNIAQIYDLGREGEHHFIVMEHVRGVDLSQLCVRGVEAGSFLPLNHAVRIIIEVCDALAYAHTQTHEDGRPKNIVHRDVSPTNILITYDGSIKLVDFGIAKATHKASVTRVGQIKGKFGYMSPEQTRGNEVDHRTDIFALGINLYEITLGRRLFQGETEMKMLDAIEACEIPKPRDLEPQYPESLERVVLKALSRDPAERYQSIRDMQMDLEAFMAEAGLRSASGMLSVYMNNLFHDQIEAEREEEKRLIEMARAGVTTEEAEAPDEDLPEALDPQESGVIELDESSLREVAPQPSALAQAVQSAVRRPTAPPPAPPPEATAPPAPPPEPAPSKLKPLGAEPSVAEPLSLEEIASSEPSRTAYSVSDDLFSVGPPPKDKPKENVTLGAPEPELLLVADDLRIKKHRSFSGLMWGIVILAGFSALGWVMYKNYLNPGVRGNPNIKVAPPRLQDLAKGPEDLPAPAPVKRALVSFESEPSGARVMLNGNPVSALTPTSAQTYADQWVEVKMSKHGYRTETRRIRLKGDEGKVHMTLSKGRVKTGKLTIESEPAGAAVIMHGETLGFTPVTLPPLRADEPHSILLAKDNHYPHVLIYTIGAGEEMDTIVRLAPERGERKQAQITVLTHPLGAEITQQDMGGEVKRRGKTSRFPIVLNAPMNQQVRLKAVKLEHESAEALIDTQKTHYTIHLRLKPPKRDYGFIKLGGPKELQAFVEREEIPIPSRHHKLLVGEHELIALDPDTGARANFKIEIEKNKTLKRRLIYKGGEISLK